MARAFDVPPYKLAIEGESEGPAMVQMGQQYLNGPISGYCERWKAKGEKFFDLDGVDTFLDMGRSATNVIGNTLATSVVAKWEGELGPEHALQPSDIVPPDLVPGELPA